MIPTTLEIPSEYNKYDIIAESGKQLNTSNAPFEFYTEDECGEQAPYNITPFTFEIHVYDADCLVQTITNLIVANVNQLYINETPLNIDFGKYDYKIEMIGYNTVISGKITVNE